MDHAACHSRVARAVPEHVAGVDPPVGRSQMFGAPTGSAFPRKRR
ncbi:hypothetical protein SAMN02745898_102227 [Streptomyces sp. 136MFCol5.1]|nr:hypothetical protein SAMN02745898_102227 [Streptomyces sp. 136MFCol5.1]SFS61677.1 hypothetical protein SAMN04487982_102357 [Streptomyces sp. ok210]